MTPEQIYDAWAPAEGRWSPWVKPVVFAHLQNIGFPTVASPAAETPTLHDFRFGKDTAVVVDLPSDQGVHVGLVLARVGHRPVPLYNAVPVPTLISGSSSAPMAIDLRAVTVALANGTATFVANRLPADAPPAFLLDSRRRNGENAMGLMPGGFDNRSVSLPSDFPSASLLLSTGIRRAVVIVFPAAVRPQADLAHTLRRWQDAKIGISMLRIGVDSEPKPIDVVPPRWYRCAWHAFLVKLGLRPHLLGGFGGFIPIPSAG